MYEVLSAGRWPVSAQLAVRLGEVLSERTEFAPAMLRRRREGLASAMFALLSDAERHDRLRLPLPQRHDIADDLVRMLVGLVTAPHPVRPS